MDGKYDLKQGEDESEYFPWFELDFLGQPICINEYATDIASGENTHIIHFDDKNAENDQLTNDNLNLEEHHQEFSLKNRNDARRRNYFIPECSIQ